MTVDQLVAEYPWWMESTKVQFHAVRGKNEKIRTDNPKKKDPGPVARDWPGRTSTTWRPG